jgi:leucyl/phenylalanyl-tRNA--protein transferase
MFSLRTDASKVALSALMAFCRAHRIPLVDCQQNTRHLASLGAREVPREAFEQHLARVVPEGDVNDWTYHRSHWALLGLHEMP